MVAFAGKRLEAFNLDQLSIFRFCARSVKGSEHTSRGDAAGRATSRHASAEASTRWTMVAPGPDRPEAPAALAEALDRLIGDRERADEWSRRPRGRATQFGADWSSRRSNRVSGARRTRMTIREYPQIGWAKPDTSRRRWPAGRCRVLRSENVAVHRHSWTVASLAFAAFSYSITSYRVRIGTEAMTVAHCWRCRSSGTDFGSRGRCCGWSRFSAGGSRVGNDDIP